MQLTIVLRKEVEDEEAATVAVNLVKSKIESMPNVKLTAQVQEIIHTEE